MNKWEKLPGLPGYGEIIQFADEGQRTYSEGLVVRAEYSDGNSWIGNFQPLSKSGVYYSGVYKFPGEDYLWVISGGQAYYVPDESPRDYKIIKLRPITYVHANIERKILVFFSYTDLDAYRGLEEIWSAEGISVDDLEFVSANDQFIKVKAWIPWKDSHPILKIDIATGERYY